MAPPRADLGFGVGGSGRCDGGGWRGRGALPRFRWHGWGLEVVKICKIIVEGMR